MDRVELEVAMKRKGLSVADLCAVIGMNRSTFYKKLRGDSEFTRGEIQLIVDALDLSSPIGIFFAQKVS